METGGELKGAIKNICYYAGLITELVKKQFEKDFEISKLTGINEEPASIRFDSLGIISSSSDWVKIYCDCMERNVENAESQDKLLRPSPEEMEELRILKEEGVPF